VVEAALAAGAELDEIYLDVLTPAMTSIGSRWRSGEIDIGLEHRATGIAMRLVGRLGPRFVRRGRSRGSVVLATPAGELHALSVAVLADLLRLEGWDVSDLGADTPAESLGLAAASPDVVAVGISVTNPQHHDACRASCAAVRRHAPGVVVVVGGQGVDGHDTAVTLGAHEQASSAKEMVQILERIVAGPPPLARANIRSIS
jgi:methanogenic corrinoid protein MtbC1